MKALILYIENIKCRFANGKIFINPAFKTPEGWHERNKTEIERYKELTRPLNQKQNRFLDMADPAIIYEIVEEQMVPDELNFADLYKQYQAKSLQRYGKYLKPLLISSKELENYVHSIN